MNQHPMRAIIFALVLILLPLALPTSVHAESIFVTCDGTDCSWCNLVDMGNGIITWLISIMFVLCGLVAAWAGVKLVTSAGNVSAKEKAKEMFTNAAIGIIIVLAAWLLVDTVMRVLVGNDGNISGYGPWQTVQCWDQEDPTAFLGDPTGRFANSNVISSTDCAATPAGNLDCSAAVSSCESAGNTAEVHQISSTQSSVNCWNVVAGSPTPLAAPAGTCNGTTCSALTIPCAAQGCTISPDMVSSLESMHTTAGVAGARVTEGYPPSREHKSQCHYNGTCIDYSKAGGMTSAEVLSVYNAATANGLRPVYEVSTETRRQELINQGVPADSVKNYGTWISGEHFSIYGQ